MVSLAGGEALVIGTRFTLLEQNHKNTLLEKVIGTNRWCQAWFRYRPCAVLLK